jgi:hypothetical protein
MVQMQDEISKLNALLGDKDNIATQSTIKMNQIMKENAALRDSLSDRERELESTKVKYSDLKVAHASLQDKVRVLLETSSDLESRISVEKEKFSQLEASYAKEKQRAAKIEAALKEAEKESQRNKAEIPENARTYLESLERKLEESEKNLNIGAWLQAKVSSVKEFANDIKNMVRLIKTDSLLCPLLSFYRLRFHVRGHFILP